jgi:hypothetical protein
VGAHAAPFWCKTEAGVAGPLLKELDGSEGKWVQVTSNTTPSTTLYARTSVRSERKLDHCLTL